MTWVFGDHINEDVDDLFGQLDQLDMVVPSLWRLEVVNAVLTRERQGKLTESDGRLILRQLDMLDLEVVRDTPSRSLDDMALFARPHQLTSYDAAYLDLAIRLNLPLCTCDRGMARAASGLGIALLLDGPGHNPRLTN